VSEAQIESTLRELRDRMRRVETRMTAYLVQQGFDTQVHRPEWKNGVVEIGSLFTPIKDILAIIPSTCSDEVEIIHKEKVIGYLSVETVNEGSQDNGKRA